MGSKPWALMIRSFTSLFSQRRASYSFVVSGVLRTDNKKGPEPTKSSDSIESFSSPSVVLRERTSSSTFSASRA